MACAAWWHLHSFSLEKKICEICEICATLYILCVKFMFRAPSGSSRRSPCSRAATDGAPATAAPPSAAGTDARQGRRDRGTFQNECLMFHVSCLMYSYPQNLHSSDFID